MSNTINIPALLESGLIEAYALGLALPEEILEVEAALLVSPEAKTALNNFEIALENQYMGTEVTAKTSVTNTEAPTFKLSKKRNWVNYAAAAAILFLIGSSAVYVFLNNKKNGIDVVKTAPAFKDAIPISCVDKNGATICYCKMVYTADNLQVIACRGHAVVGKDETLQLWGVVEGKTVDLGTFNLNDSREANQKIADLTKKYASFAITVEKTGGSKTLDADKILVKGVV